MKTFSIVLESINLFCATALVARSVFICKPSLLACLSIAFSFSLFYMIRSYRLGRDQ